MKGELKEIMENHIGALFFPHGLGHMLGLDTHDVGGYPPGVNKINEPGIKNLRYVPSPPRYLLPRRIYRELSLTETL